MTASLAEQVAALPTDDDRRRVLTRIAADLKLGLVLLLRSWLFWRRPEQVAPGGLAWVVWLVMTGRGWGKTRTGAEWVLDRCEAGACRLGALAGRTVGDVRDIMIHGESGLVACAEARGLTATYVAGKRHVLIARDGTLLAELQIVTAIEPDGPRGRAYDTVWADELAAWSPKVGPSGETCWANLLLALRARRGEGTRPQAIVTTTPKNVAVLRDLVTRSYVTTTSGSLYDNRLNLDPTFVELIVGGYEGTRLAAQEIHGILLLTVEGALWDQDAINADRWTDLPPDAKVVRTVVGVDPAAEGGTHGIVVVQAVRFPNGQHDLVVVADRSMRGKGGATAREVIRTVVEWGADEIAVESNQGGTWVREAIETAGLALKSRARVVKVDAKLAKQDRARPVAILSDRHRLHHLGDFPALEGQMTGWDPEDSTAESPDRLDAMVHAAERLRRYVVAGPPKRRKPTGLTVTVPAR